MNTPLYQEIQAKLKPLADPERAAGQQAYMKSALSYLGVRVPVVRKLAHQCCREQPCRNLAEYRAAVEQLFFEADHQEHRYAAIGICTFKGHQHFQRMSVIPLYQRLIVTAAWWDLVDELSTCVGRILLAYPQPMEKKLRAWAQHKDKWLRRAAILAQVNHKEKVNLELLYACLEPSLDSKEFFLRKAIGWALRDVAWTNPEATRSYVAAHDSRLSGLSKREALKNLKA